MTQNSLHCRAFAKINLYLEIGKKRSDGFHELKSIIQSVDLCDELRFFKSPGEILLNVESPDADPGLYTDNIVLRTARLIREKWKVKEGVEITLIKRIPTGSGLGGGSSNSSVTIRALSRLWGLGISPEEILQISSELGSDVPFFYLGGRVLVEGRGELLTPLEDVEPMTVVIVKPPFSISSADAYRWWDEATEKERLHGGDDVGGDLGNLLYNDFETIVFPRYPVLQRIRDTLNELGCSGALLSGSGSSLFGIAEDRERAQHIAGKLRECSFGEVHVAGTLRREQSCMM